MLNQSLSRKRKGFEVLMKALMLLSVGLTAALVLFLLIYDIFSQPKDQRTEDYITGRFG